MTGNGHLASAEDILRSTGGKRRYRECTLPVSGLRIRLQSLFEREIALYEAGTVDQRSGRFTERLMTATRRLIVMCLVDAEGNRLFQDSDQAKLAELDGADTQFLYNECAIHTGLSRQDIESLVKNSGETGDGDGSTESPAPAASST